VTMTIIVYRGTAWLCISPPFAATTTIKPMQINNLVDTLTQAAKKTHDHKES
jgi:hypothetical protein